MHILHVGKFYHPFSGGMETVVKDICQGLVQKQIKVTVVCSNTENRTVEEVVHGVNVIRLASFGNLFGQCLNLSVLWRLRKLAKSADLIHVHGPNPLSELAALFIPRSKPIVYTHHSDVVRQKILTPFYHPIIKKLLSRVTKIFVPTQNHIKYSQILPSFQDKCIEIPFTINPKVFEMNKEVEREVEILKSTYGEFALFVGRLVGYKGVNVLIDSMKDIKKNLIIVGEGPEENELKKQVSQLGLIDRVHFLGKVKDRGLFSAVYHACHFLVLPSVSVNENFGVVQLEAMYCSKAVVTTDLESGVPVVGERNETCLIVPPNDSQRLTMALTMLFQNPELAKSLGRKGKQRFHVKFTPQLMVDGHIDAYEQSIGINTAKEKALSKVA